MMKNYYPRLKSVAGRLVMAVASTFMVFNSESSIAQGLTSSSYSAVPGATLTLTGSGFSTTLTNNSVFFGGAKATVLSATATQLGVTVPVGASCNYISADNNSASPYGWESTTKLFNPQFDNCYVPGTNAFKPKVDFATGVEPYSAAFADLDGDGKLDMVVANHGTNQIRVYLHSTTGPGTINAASLTTGTTISLTAGATGPANIKFADLDRDGKLDIIIACNGGGGTIGLFRNTSTPGTFSFGAPFRTLITNFSSSVAVGKCSEIAVGDFDGDGKPDIAAVIREALNSPPNYPSDGFDSVKIYRNLVTAPLAAGAGFTNTSFSSPVSFALPSYSEPSSIAAADFDGDGKLDLVTANQALAAAASALTVSVFKNTSTSGTIAFNPHFELLVPANAQQVIATDLDGDGKSDIIASCADITSSSGGTATPAISIFRNIATSGVLNSSSFAARQDISVAPLTLPVALACGDYDADGKPDIMCTFTFENAVKVFKNNSSIGAVSLAIAPLTFTLPASASPVGVTFADVDGDKKCDLITANGSGSSTVSIFRSFGTPVSAPVTGDTAVCVTSTTDTFKNAVSGGTWSLSNIVRATIDPVSGKVFPIASGIDTAIYTVVCNADTAVQKMAFHIDPIPVVNIITGTATSLCTGTSITLNDVSTGGTWTSTGGAIATVSSVSGTVATIGGLTGGNATISYTLTNGCGSAGAGYALTVNTAPSAITGTTTLCINSNVTLSSSPNTGTWSPSTGGVATVNSSGVVHAVGAGTVNISYTIGTCYVFTPVTVTSGPSISLITGPSTTLCVGANMTLTDATPSGTWRSGTPSIASVSSGGMVHGIAAGAATISYIVTNGCGTDSVGYAINVLPVPGAITGPTFTVCVNQSVSLSNTITTGTWTASTAAVNVTSAGGTGTIQGASGGNPVISYTLPGGCFVTHAFTVNPLPAMPGGGSAVCQNSTITLTDADAPGSWSSSGPTPGIVTVGSATGAITGVTPGNTNIVFTQTSTGCSITLTGFTVNITPAPISGSTVACVGASNTLVSSPGGGTWSITPSGIASIDATTGMVTGQVTGSAVVTYGFSATGCSVSIPITVATSPGAISGPTTVCLGGFIALTDTPPGGGWTSSNSVAAPINSIGIVSGATLGTTVISYTLSSTGCRATQTVTVTPPPGAITGATPICPYTSITLSDPTTLGNWSSNHPEIAQVDPSTGVVTGVSGGTALISYILGATGCGVFVPVTVHDAPTIGGAPRVCVGYNTLLLNDEAGGTWSSTNTGVATINPGTGLVHGESAGTTTISYITPAFNCFDTMALTSYDTVVPSLTLMASPVLTLTGHIASVCQSTLVTYTAVVTNGGPIPGFQWRVNGTLVGTGSTYSYTPGNNDSVSCKLTSNAICATPVVITDFIKMNVITRQTPTLNLATGIGDTTCLGNPVTLNPNPSFAGAAPTYSWKVNGVNVGPGSTFTYIPANGDVITVVVHSSYICPLVDTATDTLHLTVSPYVTPVVTLVGSDTACELYPTVFVAMQTGGGTIPVYQFLINSLPAPAGTVSGNTLAYMANTGDVVSVTMTSNFPCVTTTTVSSAPHTITVIPVPIPSISVSIYPGYILAPGMNATFIATPVNPGTNPSYQWFKNGVVITGATDLTYVTNVFATGDDFKCVMTTNNICNHISVFGYATIYVGDNVGVSTVNSPNSHVDIMPNPSRGTFTIIGNTGIASTEEVTAEVTNMLGQVVYTARFTTTNGAMEQAVNLGDNLANGMYILNLRSEHLARTIHIELTK